MRRTIAIAGFALLSLCAVGYWFFSKQTSDSVPLPNTEPSWFEDVTDEAGITFVHDPGDLSNFWMPRINGSGVAVFDCDGDDKLDLYFLNFGGPDSASRNCLYRNMGNGKYRDATAGSGLGIAGNNTGVIVGDVDNDGKPDVVVTQYNGVKLFRNLGEGRFADITPESGLKNPVWATSANLFDYDRDGWLDLAIVNYVDYDPTRTCHDPTNRKDYCGPHLFPHTVSKLFRNRGAAHGPRFQDFTVQAGLAAAPGPGLGIYSADFTGDGWPDIFIANDLKANHLWINQKNGTFQEEGIVRGIGLDGMGSAMSGMGVAVGDVDNDGMFDVYVTHLTGESNTLWKQGPKRGFFRDQTAATGLLGTQWRGTGWGTVMADFDRDGWLDLALVNGRVNRDSGKPHPPLGAHFQHYGERNQVFRNDGTGKFVDRSDSDPDFCRDPNVGRGLAVGDLDGDGALDLVTTSIAGRSRILKNVAAPGRWVIVRAFDPRLNREAYGSEVTLRVGGRRMFRVVQPGDSFQSCSDSRVHFGLGTHGDIEAIEVHWPDGLRESFPGGTADRTITLNRGEGTAMARPASGAAP